MSESKDFDYPIKPPLSAHADRLRIMLLTGQRDALVAALLDMLPLIEYYTHSSEHARRTKAAREILASVQGPPDPADWREP